MILGLLGCHDADSNQIFGADEAIADPASTRVGNCISKRNRPVVFDEKKRCGRVVRDLLGVCHQAENLGELDRVGERCW
jgi:hypothetical protein